LVILALLAAGCAASGDRVAGRAMQAGEWDRAVRILTTQSTERPGDAKVWARLGEAQYNAGRDAEAADALDKALVLDEKMYGAHLFLGYVAERQNNLDRALWHYQVYVDRRPDTKAARDTHRRIDALKRARAAVFAKEALAKERELSPASYPDSSIGVVYFNGDRLPDSLRPLAKGLAHMMVTDLSKVSRLLVVERLRVDKILEELKLSSSAAFDSTTAPRMGKLLGAAHVLGGDISGLPQERLRVDPQLVSAKTGEVELPGEQVGALSRIMAMEKDMVFSVLKQMGIKLRPEERTAIAKVPTDSLAAFLAFSRGLEYADRGDYEKAEREFDRARTIDPSFSEAGQRATEAGYLSGSSPSAEPQHLEEFAAATSGSGEWQTPITDTGVRLNAFLENAGLIRPVGTEAPADNPYTPPAPGESSVIINGRFDE
jgi:tetratricopeptide (TPR) repeat protein